MPEYAPLTVEEEQIGRQIVAAAYAVHRELGPGLLESIYEACVAHELIKQGLSCRRQVVVPIVYDGLTFEEGFRLDLLVEDRVICELKSVERLAPVFEAQLLSYMKLTHKRLGFMINFNEPLVKQGIKRMIR